MPQDFSAEAIEYVQLLYDCPHLIHQTHIRMILDTICLKDFSGRKLHCLHDTAQRYLQAHTVMEYEPLLCQCLSLNWTLT